jgi:hypothetical protein
MRSRTVLGRPVRPPTKREIYKGRVVQPCAVQTEGGTWRPMISIQLRSGVTDLYEVIIEEEFQSLGEAKRRSSMLAKRLIDEGNTLNTLS